MLRAAEKLNVTNEQNLDEFVNIDQNTLTEDEDFESQRDENNEIDDQIENAAEEENKIKCYIIELTKCFKHDYVASEQINY